MPKFGDAVNRLFPDTGAHPTDATTHLWVAFLVLGALGLLVAIRKGALGPGSVM